MHKLNFYIISNADHWKEMIISAQNHVKGNTYIVNDLQIIANAFQQNQRLLCQGYSFLPHKYRVVFSAWKASYYIKYRPVLIRLFARLYMAHSIFSFITLSSSIHSLYSHPKVLLSILILAVFLLNHNLQEEKEGVSAELVLQSNFSTTTTCNKSNAFFTQAQMRNSVVLQIRLWKENVVVDWQQEII